jgi:hypothetical protein
MGVLVGFEHRSRVSNLFEPPSLQPHDAICHLGYLVEVMADEDHGAPNAVKLSDLG